MIFYCFFEMTQFMVVFYGHYLKKCKDFQYRRYFKSITFESTSSLKITFTRFAERQIFRILAFDFTALFTILRLFNYSSKSKLVFLRKKCEIPNKAGKPGAGGNSGVPKLKLQTKQCSEWANYSQMDQENLWETAFKEFKVIWSIQTDHIRSNFLKVVFHNFTQSNQS